MITNSAFNGIPCTFTKNNNPAILIFEDLSYFYCTVHNKPLIACIYGHEMLLQNFGLWVSFSDGSHFLMCTDQLSSSWVALAPGDNDYANAIQDKLEEFFNDNYDKLSTICTG